MFVYLAGAANATAVTAIDMAEFAPGTTISTVTPGVALQWARAEVDHSDMGDRPVHAHLHEDWYTLEYASLANPARRQIRLLPKGLPSSRFPNPGTLALSGLGLAGLGLRPRRKM